MPAGGAVGFHRKGARISESKATENLGHGVVASTESHDMTTDRDRRGLFPLNPHRLLVSLLAGQGSAARRAGIPPACE